MGVIARVLGVSALTSALTVGLGLALLGRFSGRDVAPSAYVLPAFLLACVGGVIGAIAGAAREVAPGRRAKPVPWFDLD